MSRTPERLHYDFVATRVGEILHWDWDPIGVAGVPQARDEYDSYVPQVVQMLIDGKKKEEIARHLYQIETESMGLTKGSHPSDHVEEVAATLIDHYDWIKESSERKGSGSG
jgi:hypothetical protein